MNPKKIIQTIKKNKHFLITSHVSPDADALSSEIALALFLESLGKKAFIVNEVQAPSRFSFMPGVKKIKSFKGRTKVDYDVAIVVDCGELSRVGKVERLVQGCSTIINVDHHVTNDQFADFNYIDPKASSTAEVLYRFFQSARFKLDKKIAMLLYIGIVTDTGSFRYENTSAYTHLVVADLMRFKIPVNQLYRQMYETVPYRDITNFLAVIKTFKLFEKSKIACVELNEGMLKKFSQEFDLRDKIFTFLRTIKSVEVVVIFSQIKKNKIRVNLRSQGKVDVAKIACLFKGGGHKGASGCLIDASIEQAKKRLFSELRKVL